MGAGLELAVGSWQFRVGEFEKGFDIQGSDCELQTEN